MPKEYIRRDGDDFSIAVGWTKNGDTNIVVENPWKTGYDAALVKRSRAVQIATVDHHGGHFVSMDRQEINDLIRLLRKSRDQAYGEDA